MPSSKEYLSYIMEQLAPLEGITTRQMTGAGVGAPLRGRGVLEL